MDRHFVKGGAMTLILRVLADTPMDGYGLIQTIRRSSEGIFNFSDGTVSALDDLLDDWDLFARGMRLALGKTS